MRATPATCLHRKTLPRCRTHCRTSPLPYALAVQVKPYEALLGDVSAAAASGARLWLDPARVSYAVYQAAAAAAKGETGRVQGWGS